MFGMQLYFLQAVFLLPRKRVAARFGMQLYYSLTAGPGASCLPGPLPGHRGASLGARGAWICNGRALPGLLSWLVPVSAMQITGWPWGQLLTRAAARASRRKPGRPGRLVMFHCGVSE